MPIYVRAGAIIPFDPVRQYTSQEVEEPTTLKIYRGADGQYTLYDDDGISLDYLKGSSTRTLISWNDAEFPAMLLQLHPTASVALIRTRCMDASDDGWNCESQTFRSLFLAAAKIEHTAFVLRWRLPENVVRIGLAA